MNADHVAQVRRFHRLVTQRAGVLQDHFLGRDRPVGHSRVLYEIGTDGADLRELRHRLDLDSGYLSRIVQSLMTEGLVVLHTAQDDERVRRARLTRAGRAEVALMNERSDEAAQTILTQLDPPQRERLVAAMDEVRRLLTVAGTRIERVDPASETAHRCIAQFFAELQERFEAGFDPGQSLPADDDDLRAPRGAFLVASVDGVPVASGAVKTIAPGMGSIKRMWVAGEMRGRGVGRRMLAALEAEARALGMTKVRLETNRALDEAIRLYQSAGYVQVAPFNADPYAHHWFEKALEP